MASRHHSNHMLPALTPARRFELLSAQSHLSSAGANHLARTSQAGAWPAGGGDAPCTGAAAASPTLSTRPYRCHAPRPSPAQSHRASPSYRAASSPPRPTSKPPARPRRASPRSPP
eukprot:scaffold20268_cov111-Isochrysis_galbana.AAC.8